MQVEEIDIDLLVTDQENAREHPEENIEAIKNSIAKFHQVEPLVVQKSTKMVIGGNARLQCLKEMGYKKVFVYQLDLDDKSAKALALALNKTGDLSTWDVDNLKLAVNDLIDTDFNMIDFGFNPDELHDLIDLPDLPDLSSHDEVKVEVESSEDDEQETTSIERDTESSEEQGQVEDTGTEQDTPNSKFKRGEVRSLGNITLANADCLEHLKTLPDNHFDSLVTDPPYGLSSQVDIRAVMKSWLTDKKYDHKDSGGFMGKKWDNTVPDPVYWKEVFRVLKPGSHGLVFAGTRTADLMAVALRFAGFEIRDCFHWIYGSGFPKSLNVSKAIDKRAGAEREVIGASITAPATEEAKKWNGFGSSLKPAHEPVWVIRKPLEGSIVDNLLKYGTGAIDIDGSRVGNEIRENSQKDTSAWHGNNWSGSPQKNSGEVKVVQGRFPANFILSHTVDCTKEVKAITNAGGLGKGGKETVEDWICSESCPVKLLDQQSGILKSGSGKKNTRASKDIYESGHRADDTEYESSSGGASRFFKTFTPDYKAPFIYAAKASKSDRNAGLEHFPLKKADIYDDRPSGQTGQRLDGRAERRMQNIHPTVKSQKLMEYLVNLVTPSEGAVLDCFNGCFDKDTEVLTISGWKYFEDLNDEDLLYSLNPKTHEIEVSGFHRKIKYKHTGDMYSISGRSVDLLVTPNHMIYAKEYHHEEFKLYKMEDFKFKTFHKLAQGIWKGTPYTGDNLWLEFLGFWLADGYKVTRSESHRGWVTGFNLSKERKKSYLEDLLDNLNIKYLRFEDGERLKYQISNKEIYNQLDGNSYTKRVPKFIFKLDPKSISRFLKGFREGDGYLRYIYSVNKGLIDDLQILTFLSGVSSTLGSRVRNRSVLKDGRVITSEKEQYQLSLLKENKKIQLKSDNISKHQYDDYVYDVTLDKNHILYVRRNGKCVWSGNSGSTGVAATNLGFKYYGIERELEYCDISWARLQYAKDIQKD